MRTYEALLSRIEAGDLSWLRNESWVRQTALSRKELYNRWHAVSNQPDDFYTSIAIRQAAEYAAMGQTISYYSGLSNPLVLGADDHKMGRFYGLTSNLPVLYLKRNYE